MGSDGAGVRSAFGVGDRVRVLLDDGWRRGYVTELVGADRARVLVDDRRDSVVALTGSDPLQLLPDDPESPFTFAPLLDEPGPPDPVDVALAAARAVCELFRGDRFGADFPARRDAALARLEEALDEAEEAGRR